MKAEALQMAVELAEKGRIFVATSNKAGLPHIAAAEELVSSGNSKVSVSEWFCPGTIANIEQNRRVAIAVWNPETDKGYQLLGEIEAVEELGILDRYSPETESKEPLPQVLRQLLVRVSKILDFKRAPHSDVDE